MSYMINLTLWQRPRQSSEPGRMYDLLVLHGRSSDFDVASQAKPDSNVEKCEKLWTLDDVRRGWTGRIGCTSLHRGAPEFIQIDHGAGFVHILQKYGTVNTELELGPRDSWCGLGRLEKTHEAIGPAAPRVKRAVPCGFQNCLPHGLR